MGTCAQAAIAQVTPAVREFLELGDDRQVVCGISFGFADPDARLGYAYVMNKLDFYLCDDPREKSLRDAVYRAIARLTDRPHGHDDGAGSRQAAVVSTPA